MEFSHVNQPVLFLLRFLAIISSCMGSTVENLLSQGTLALSNGQMTEALKFYSDAILADPNNYMAVYRRSTVYIAIGKLRSALRDIETTIELNPGFVLAHKQKASVHLKLGNLKDASASLLILRSNDPDAQDTLNQIEDMKANIEQAKRFYKEAKYSEAIPLLDFVIATITSSSELREMRANCYLQTGEHMKGIEELRQSVHMMSDNREGMLRVSVLMYDVGLVARSLEEVRGCLQLDQDDKNCRQHYNKVKTLADAQIHSESKKWDRCLIFAKRFLNIEKNNAEAITQANALMCRCCSRSKPEEALAVCDDVIKRMPRAVKPHFDKAEAYISLQKYTEAEAEYREILNLEPDNHEAKEGIKTAQRLIKTANKRDYYKILGVKRNADNAEIMRAYRVAAAASHPDSFADPEEKKAAEKKFIELGEAREVLLNKEMRAQFDSGVDPRDPEAQQHRGPFGGGGGHQFFTDGGPFGFQFQNFNPFGGGGGNFEFHFG